MVRCALASLPASLRGVLEELASADAAASQRWIVSLLQEQGPGVIHVLWRMLGREQDVLDVYQTVVCHLASRGPALAGRNRAAYFYRSAINAAIESIRRHRRERERLPRVAATVRWVDDTPACPEPQQIMERLRGAVHALPAHLRDVVVLRDLSGMKYRQVASILNITSGTARVYRRQAIVRLAAMLAREERS